jgi:hypothetical protein
LIGPFKQDWQIVGVVNERRELTSPKNPNWRGHVVKLAGLGQTFELQVSLSMFNQVEPGVLMDAAGHFEHQRGELKLVVDRMEPMGQQAPVRPRAVG